MVLPQNNKYNVFISLFIILLILVLTSITSFYLGKEYQKQRYATVPQIRVTPAPTPITNKQVNNSQILKKDTTYFSYVSPEDGNIYIEDMMENNIKVTDIKDKNLIIYSYPKILDTKKIVYVEEIKAEKSRQFSLIIKNIQTNQQETIVTHKSIPNDNGYLIGGEITEVSVSDNGEKIAYSVYEVPTLENSKVTINVYDVDSKTSNKLVSITPPGGRGGSLDDNNQLIFSEDGKKLIANMTFMLPNFFEDTGSLYIFDISTQEVKVLYKNNEYDSKKGTNWATFGVWKSNNITLFKLINYEVGSTLVSFNTSTLNKNIETNNISDWYEFMPTNNNSFIYYTVNRNGRNGITVYDYSFNTNTSTKIIDNMRPKYIVGNNLYATVMEPCNNKDKPVEGIKECGMDVFNGVKETENAKIIDLQTKQITNAPENLGRLVNNYFSYVSFKKL